MLSVVCPIYNEEKYIAKCLDSIIEQDYPKNDIELLLVDGMSTDHTRDVIVKYQSKYPWIKILDNPKRIAPCAMNIGIKASSGDIIIRLDAHVLYPKNYFSELVKNLKVLENAENVGAVCNTLPMNNSVEAQSIAAVLSSSFGMGNSYFRVGASEVMKVDTVPFGCFHRSIFNKIGLYDEELVRNQDDELNARIIKSGGSIYLLPNLVCKYYARDTATKVYKMFYQYGMFKPLVNKKLGSPATVRQFFPLLFVLGLLLGPIVCIFVPVLWRVYIAVILLWLLLATYFSCKDTKQLKRILMQDWIYFVVHFSYGWGYIVGIYKIIFRKSFVAQVNR